MENDRRRCYNCWRYSAYYTKQITFFEKLNYGRCSYKDEPVQDKYETCELWQPKRKRTLRQMKAASEALCRAADSICMLQQVLCEEGEEE